ncbi:MAG: response regulator [Salinibacter sp.]
MLEEYRSTGSVDRDMFEQPLSDKGQPDSAVDSTDSHRKGAITFTSGTDSEGQSSFPIREVEETAEVDFVQTLRPLREIDSPRPIFLKETYSSPGDGLGLLLRIRLGYGFGGTFSRYPIYIKLETPLQRLLERNLKYAILCTQGVNIVESFPNVGDINVKPLSPTELDAILDQLPIRPDPQIDHHDLTNAWGALRLWQGYQLLQGGNPQISEPLAQHRDKLLQREYYAYLAARSRLNQHGDTESDPPESGGTEDWKQFLTAHHEDHGRPLQILLIDDEAGKGWEEALSLTLMADVEDGASLTVYPPSGAEFDKDKALETAVNEDWDLVLCDLRLNLSRDKSLTADSDPSKRADYTGIELVQSIKTQKPTTPVIAFTASKTTWTTHAAQEAGVDGYWVKESSERSLDKGYSQQSVRNLYSLIQRSVRKRRQYAFLWTLIEKVRRAQKDSEMLSQISAFQGNQSTEALADVYRRIEHLLLRAYGYLDVRVTSFQKNAFRYDPAGIAFIHLWGCLNQITELRFRFDRSEARLLAQGYQSKRIWDCGQPEIWEDWVYDSFLSHLPSGISMDPCRSENSKRGPDYVYSALLLADTGKNRLSRRLWDYELDTPLKEIRNKLDFIHGRISLSEIQNGESERNNTTDDWVNTDVEGQVELNDIKDLTKIIDTGLFPAMDY